MKYKLWGMMLFFCAIALSLVAPFLESSNKSDRFHQHLEAADKTEESIGVGFATHLPLVMIDTGGMEIPGRSIHLEDGSKYYSTAPDGSELISAYMHIVDRETEYAHPGDVPTLSSKITIHIRGRSSRHFDKPNYAIRSVTEDGQDRPMTVMGMEAHHEWVLHGPFLDKTLIRNYMWYNIGGEIMGYAPNVRFCELMLNGEYQGVYVMLENLTAGKDGSRLPLTVSAKNNTFSGYLLQYNGGEASKRTQIDQFTHYARRGVRGQMDIVYPGRRSLTAEMAAAIRRDFSDFEKALYSYDYDNEKYGYRSLIDTQCFIDYFLINELTCNYDAGRFSTYISKGTDGKFHIYLWDMNSCCDNYQEQAVEAEGFQMTARPWYYMLMKDEDFVNSIIERYWQLRQTWFDEAYLCQYIDETVAYLGDAVDRNFERWGYTFDPGYTLLYPEGRNQHSYDEAVEHMKGFLQKRIRWMDENIESLKQYSAESAVKEYNENAN